MFEAVAEGARAFWGRVDPDGLAVTVSEQFRAWRGPCAGASLAPAVAGPGAPESLAPLRARSRQHQHTATGPPPFIERVTVTLPAHPLKGMELPVVRFIRSQEGRRYVDVEHPPGQYMRLPLEWTDRSPPFVPPSVGGREVRLSIPALLELASAVQVALGRTQGPSATPLAPVGPTLIHANVSFPEIRPPVGGTAHGAKAATARHVGRPAAQGAARRNRRRGGRR
ncbi:DUF5953 family protein [Cystobacter fuscus]